ncbi:DUF349 domain-containing protein [sulfur-oxidizing endosymbiont of Gigantopelta aegis]|uniref:DUF349 domain-containing protein n=1 Tax=sulfur-oxidizing endosymbiont of Gigantopelta aegis TaxID=2794934 RepID=UPI0018DC0676|nr:DUF349 domain-containing protein [sulfur-oxidizing endosymbiont of Gigantopelta aegis]
MTQQTNILNKLFKPLLSPFTKNKWQSRNIDTRKKAVLELPVSDQETLSHIAMNDSDESIRAIAANKLSNLDLLQTIIMKGTNGTVKQAAQNRLFQLICGLKHPVPEFALREKMIRGSRNSALLEFVAANAEEASLREITIKKISRDPLLGDIALRDDSPHIRQLAAQQIAKRSTLERVTKNSRRKDKRVYKIVKNKLDHIIEDEQRPALLAQEVTDICIKLEKLHKRKRLLQEKTTVENYVTRWSAIQNFASPETTERYHTICKQIINDIDALELAQQQEHNAIQSLESLLNNLSLAVDDLLTAREALTAQATDSEKKTETESTTITSNSTKNDTIQTSETVIQNLGREWDNIIALLSKVDLIADYNNKFQAILDLADTHSDFQQGKHNKNSEQAINSSKKLITLTEQAEKLLSKTGFIPEKTISALQEKFEQAIQANHHITESLPDDIKQVHEKFSTIIKSLKKQLHEQQQSAKNFQSQIESQTTQIQTFIQDGLISKAEKLLKSQLKDIDQSNLISNIEKQHYQAEAEKLHTQLTEFSSWRHWAHDNERENLAIKAEQLTEQAKNLNSLEDEYTDITAQIKELRAQWKSMHSHTQEELWQRFNRACNSAYELCQPFIDKQTEIRAEHLKAKEDLCIQLEDYIQTMGWPTSEGDEINHSIDWIQVDKITKQARKEWSEIGFVERKHHKSINHRFDKIIETIRTELKKTWSVNHEQFFSLIEKVEALHETLEDNLADAINKAKKYQQDWKQIGPVSSFQRNKLWKRFRKGCDVIFNKRQESIEQKNNAETKHLREKEAICENLEALNQQPLKESDLRHAFADIETIWKEHEHLAKSLSKTVNLRYAKAIEDYQNKLAKLQAEQQKQQLDFIIQQAALCSQIETSANSDNIDELKEQWLALKNNDLNLSLLDQRYNKAISAIELDKTDMTEAELSEKQTFCLKYEILLGKESPEAAQQARMEMQVELLNSNLGQKRNEASTNDKISPFELQIKWYQMSNYAQDAELEARFEALLGAI